MQHRKRFTCVELTYLDPSGRSLLSFPDNYGHLLLRDKFGLVFVGSGFYCRHNSRLDKHFKCAAAYID